MIDLRSDTVTRPPPGMRRAMADAEVGDDVFGDDPTVNALEAYVAALLGKEAALFMPSGVMSNQVALRIHTRPGDEVILAERSHILQSESGAPAVLSGLQLRPVEGPTGFLTAADVTTRVRARNDWEPRTRLVCLENTINHAGGRLYPQALVDEVADAARAHGLALHLDGARLWNAAVATGRTEADLAAPFDTVSVCLSKGLGAPVGSLLAGPRDLLRDARRVRKQLGGGMRQVGILAAAGRYALHHHRADLATDHARAQRLADVLAPLPAFHLDRASVETNIVIFETVTADAATVLADLAAHGVAMVAFGPRRIRAVFHRDLTDAEVDRVMEVVELLGCAVPTA